MGRLLAAVLAVAFPTVALAGHADSVVRVVRASGYGSFGMGSGTCIACESGKSLVVTNRHVVPDQGVRTVVQQYGQTYEARLLSIDTADLAVLEVDGELTAAEVADAEPPRGASVELIAHPHGGNQAIMTGQWVGSVGMESVCHTCEGAMGTSGGAVFYQGKVVAVHWGAGVGDGLRYAVPLMRVRGFVARVAFRLFPRLTARLTGAKPVAVGSEGTVPAPKSEPLPKPKEVPTPKAKKVEPKKPEPKKPEPRNDERKDEKKDERK